VNASDAGAIVFFVAISKHFLLPQKKKRKNFQHYFLCIKLVPSGGSTRVIGSWRCTCFAWPFSSASKPINLGLGFEVHWVHIQLGFPASTLVGTLNG
jgi:hypothetical protein